MGAKTKKRLLKEAHNMAKNLHAIGAIDVLTMREFDALCFPNLHEPSPQEIKKIRKHTGVSQPIFAKIINVSLATIKQWERGERKPSGPAIKLLNLISDRGINAVI